MNNQHINIINKSSDSNYISVDGRQYVSIDHILETQQWVAREKENDDRPLFDFHKLSLEEVHAA